MSDWPECEFIVNDGAEGGAPEKSPFKTGWENVIFVVEDEERPPSSSGRRPKRSKGSQVTYDEILRRLSEMR